MARTDIMGLLTGATQPQVDPRVKLTPAQQRMQFAKDRARGMEQGFRGMMGLGANPQQQIQSALAKKALQQAREAESGIGQINPQFYTPESIEAFNRHFATTGQKNYNLLKEIDTIAKTFKVEQTRSNVTSMKKRSDALSSAQSVQLKVNQMQELLDSGLKTGALAQLSRGGQNLVQSFFPDVEFESLSELEVFNALSNQLALLVRNPDSGMGLPGATSNRDLAFLIDSVPNLRKSVGGNKLLLEVYDKMYQLQVATSEEQARIITENGGTPPLDLETQLASFVASYDVFGDDLRNELNKVDDAPFQDYSQSDLDDIIANEYGDNKKTTSLKTKERRENRYKKPEDND